MPSQVPVEFKSPLKGVMKNPSFSDLNPEFAADALNVLPQDKDGRYRVNQRAGTSKMQAAALSGAVMLLAQTSIPLDPSTLPLSVFQVNDAFPGTYTIGQRIDTGTNYLANNTNGLPGIAQVFSGVSRSTVQAGGLTVNAADTTVTSYQWTGPTQVGKVYSVKATWTGISGGLGADYAVFARRNNGSPSASLVAIFHSDSTSPTVQLRQADQGVTYYSAALSGANPVGGSVTLELRVTGNSVKVFVNSVLQTTQTVTPGSTDTGCGFSCSALGGLCTAFSIQTADPRAVYRQTNVIAVAGGTIYEGDPTLGLAAVTGGSSLLDSSLEPGFAYSQGFGYFVDGTQIVKLDIAAKATAAYSAVAGTAPVGCTLACVYRDRLVLAGQFNTPQNFFCSRVGVHNDWDYSQLANNDPASAFAGNASTAGHIGDPIIALMPFSDDVLLIGGDHNLWVMRGDPADSGSIDMLSDSIGVLGPNAWTKTPEGTLYFLGTGGLYKMPYGPSSVPVNISSGSWNEFFRTIDRTHNFVKLLWDREQHNLYVFITPTISGPATHLVYDDRKQAFWPIQFPATHGPISALVFDGDASTDRVALLGGRTGFIQRLDGSSKNDDGTAISSFVYIGPYAVSDVTESVLEWMDVILGDPNTAFTVSDFACTATVQAGQSVEKAITSPLYSIRRTFTTPRRQVKWLSRLRGNVFFLKLANSTLNKTWSLEKAIGMFMGGGLVRRR